MEQCFKKTDAYIAGVCKCYQSAKSTKVHISEPHHHVGAMSNSDSMSNNWSMATRWIPPTLVNDTGDYHDQVLGESRYL
jgi:hypothetical protein